MKQADGKHKLYIPHNRCSQRTDRVWREILILVCLGSLAGCSLQRTTAHNLGFEHHLRRGDNSLEREIRADAHAALRQLCGKHDRKSFSQEYELGFSDGYFDFLDRGGPVQPPPLPPTSLRRKKYLTAEGQAKVRDYFLGFQYGGQIAESTGRREFLTVPIVLSEAPVPPPLNITVLPSPPEPLPEGKP